MPARSKRVFGVVEANVARQSHNTVNRYIAFNLSLAKPPQSAVSAVEHLIHFATGRNMWLTEYGGSFATGFARAEGSCLLQLLRARGRKCSILQALMTIIP